MRVSRYIFGVIMIVVVLAGDAAAEWRLRPTYLAGTGGYDTNVNRAPSDAPAPFEPRGDGRFVLFGGIGGEYRVPRRFSASLDFRPFYVKHASEDAFDRLEFGTIGKLQWTIKPKLSLVVDDLFRYVVWPNRDALDRTFNLLRPRLAWRVNDHTTLSVIYRNVFRHRPRSNIDIMTANGVAASAVIAATDRVTLSILGSYDDEHIQFVFPRDVSGFRATGDVSGQYFVGNHTIVQAKYLYQRDRMEFIFSQGPDIDKLGDSAEDVTDGPFQSIRFLEDSDYNFWKSLVIASSQTNIGDYGFLSLLGLYQFKRYEERVLVRADRPRREDQTALLQATYQHGFNQRWAALMHLRWEGNKSNDPAAGYRFGIVGVGIKRTF